MRGMIAGIKRMEIHDGDGLRTTVFFKGCPLRCVWCHNPESLSRKVQVAFFDHKCIGCGSCKGERNESTAARCPTDAITVYGREYELDALVEEILQDEAFFRSGGGVTLSGGECLAQGDFAVALAERLHGMGISVYVDTCGFVPREVLARILPYTDKFLYDIKAVDPIVHQRCTGQDNRVIFENLRFLCEQGCEVEIRFPLVMGYNDGECEKIARLVAELPRRYAVKVLPYHAFSASRYKALGMPDTLPKNITEASDVARAVAIFRAHGVYAINGMIED